MVERLSVFDLTLKEPVRITLPSSLPIVNIPKHSGFPVFAVLEISTMGHDFICKVFDHPILSI